ncbi:MAG TPA: serine/threonine protein kinase [Oscillatoriaceae cyanobacterium M33_DOE_052]|uniref:non-specific serine/threonine protein kinase n=1 Tax=Planktothricoides sp. SpSt-374 TaxID=2282167 RepID=A0A7C3VMB9_9CYAN|nr:serine/threonine protein kinase [Oscillatoriaceae cyanobacterium M33_DOE_052]
MKIYCTRPGCHRPENHFAELDDRPTLLTVQQKYCITCGMPLILDGRYLPDKLLGKGGFGAAFLAHDRRTPTQRPCVVKLFQPEGTLNPQQQAIAQSLFDREAIVLEKLGSQHPQIPDLLAYFALQTPGWPQPQPEKQYFYIVQEFIDGQNLEQELQQKGKFSETEVLQLLQELLPVLQFIHENDTIHRDIKPSNIMRSRSQTVSQSGRLYLLDFGAVKLVTGAVSGKSTTIYSSGFAPPEQMAGRSVFPSTDLYALAVTCIVLLTGKLPKDLFDAYRNQWQWRSHTTVSDSLAAVLDRMLLPTPSDRFATATQVLTALSAPPTPPKLPISGSPSPPVSPSPPPLPPTTISKRPFSTNELLTGAGFIGFEGCLLLISLEMIIPNPAVGTLCWVLILGSLIWVQYQRWLTTRHLVIIATLSIGLAMSITPLPWSVVLLSSASAGLATILATAIFRLIYSIISHFI